MRDFLAWESGVPPAGPDSEGRFLCCDAATAAAGVLGETPFEPAAVSAAADRLCSTRDRQEGCQMSIRETSPG